MFFVDMKTD